MFVDFWKAIKSRSQTLMNPNEKTITVLLWFFVNLLNHSLKASWHHIYITTKTNQP